MFTIMWRRNGSREQCFLDQLTQKSSPDALAIPVALAVALLKDRHGEINLHLPVSGSINDPQFRISPVRSALR
jgi:hypothetical protein